MLQGTTPAHKGLSPSGTFVLTSLTHARAGHTQTLMNEWGLISQEIFVGIAMSATSFKFKSRRGYVRDERLVLSNPHSS
ncbi:MAG: hypothetical protein RIC80_03165, partial [Cyclobacteriaceae bacterium]